MIRRKIAMNLASRENPLPPPAEKQDTVRSSYFNLKVPDRDSVFSGVLAAADGTFIAIEFDFAENDKYSRAHARKRALVCSMEFLV